MSDQWLIIPLFNVIEKQPVSTSWVVINTTRNSSVVREDNFLPLLATGDQVTFVGQTSPTASFAQFIYKGGECLRLAEAVVPDGGALLSMTPYRFQNTQGMGRVNAIPVTPHVDGLFEKAIGNRNQGGALTGKLYGNND